MTPITRRRLLASAEAGLFFICFQRDPQRQFVPIQRRLGSNDALNEYIKQQDFACVAALARAGRNSED